MGRRKRGQFEESALMNDRTYLFYYNRLKELAINMFEWKNLPESIDPRFLELCLFEKGMSVFFYEDGVGYLALNTMISGKLNVYNIPTIRNAYATNGFNRQLDGNNSVIIFNNFIHTNTVSDVEMYAKRLYEIERTIDVNVKAQKTPTLILCDENQRLTMKNLYMQYDGNEPFIFGSKNLDIKGISSLKTDAPYVADKLQELKNSIWNEALTYLGISNVNNMKKERLITDEVIRNMGGVEAQKYTRLNARKQACEQINSMFGLNIDVDFRDTVNVVDSVKPYNDFDVEGGEDNE